MITHLRQIGLVKFSGMSNAVVSFHVQFIACNTLQFFCNNCRKKWRYSWGENVAAI